MSETVSPDTGNLVQRLLSGELAVAAFLEQLPAGGLPGVVAWLKAEANRHWAIDPHVSLVRAEKIIQIGEATHTPAYVALGKMARGDSLKFLGRYQESWEALDEAGQLFQAIGDEVGWARTRIGPVFICVELNRVGEAMRDAQKAHGILARRYETELLINLEMNMGAVHSWMGDCTQALERLHSALERAEALGPAGEAYLGRLNLNIGCVYRQQGDFRQALDYHRRALHYFTQRRETHWITTAELNIASLTRAQGHYKQALQLLSAIQDTVQGRLPVQAADTQHEMVMCYLALNRYREARDLAEQVVRAYDSLHAHYAKARALFNLATAEAELAHFDEAGHALDAAAFVFQELGASPWLVSIHLWRGVIALKQGNTAAACREIGIAAEHVTADDHYIGYASVLLRQAQVRLAGGDIVGAGQSGMGALRRAQRNNQAWERYSAHVVLGRVAEARANTRRAFRHYYAASATVERVQRGLTLTLRPGFLEDKAEALHALIRLHLDAGQIACAFETLERAKSQVFLNYLTSRETLRWNRDDPHVRALQDELERLRGEHHWYYQLATKTRTHEESHISALTSDQALGEVAQREKQMRAITEQLYLHSHRDSPAAQAMPLTLADIQCHLAPDTLLIEYYNDGSRWWAFALDQQQISAHLLEATVRDIDALLVKFQFNLACALSVGPEAPVANHLVRPAQQFCQQFYTALLRPLEDRLQDRQRLVIVPYGGLHYLPFHVLHTGREYVIQRYEVVSLPATRLITHSSPRRPGGALVLAHSQNGTLPQTLAEAQLVHDLLGGEMKCDEAAQRTALHTAPRQVLHIAAHGEFRMDQPDLAYIELADGQLYTDDLLQHDLSYELITLSACETGRARVAAGDELIGLSRGCLYAGAGALVVSLWRVGDVTALTLMESFYRALLAGASKVGALRESQVMLLAAQPALHPAFWGAFQLAGNPDPLSAARV